MDGDAGVVALEALAGGAPLVVADTEGGNETVLNDHFYPPTFRWSPDGAWIAFASEDQHANSEIYIVPATGGEAYNVSRHPDFDELPVWSPDGTRIARRALGNRRDLWVSPQHRLYREASKQVMEHLKGLTQLHHLSLSLTPVTDTELEHVKELTQLEVFFLDGTKVTDTGVRKLQRALPNCEIIR